MKCKLCDRDANDKFCKYHELAYEQLKQGYEAWKEAYDISWKEYLERLLKNRYTGSWVKDVIRYELEGLFKDG